MNEAQRRAARKNGALAEFAEVVTDVALNVDHGPLSAAWWTEVRQAVCRKYGVPDFAQVNGRR